MPSQHTPLDPQPRQASPTEDDNARSMHSSGSVHKEDWKGEESDRASPGGSADSRTDSRTDSQADNCADSQTDSASAQPTAPATPTLPTVSPPTPEPTLGTESKLPLENGDVPKDEEPLTMTVHLVVPPDGGWGWVIVAASFMCNLVVDGIIFTYGMVGKELASHFDVSGARAAVVGSLLAGLYLMAGPFVSALANRYGFRLVTIVGAILGCAGFALSSLATSIEFLFVTYGVLGGIGFGMIYVPAVITTGFYFERWRAMATGIAVCGSGIGTFLMAPLCQVLIKHLGWQGTLLIQAGMILNCAVFGALFRPLLPTKVEVPYDPVKAAELEAAEKAEEAEKADDAKLPLLMRIKMARDEMRAQSTASLHDAGAPAANNNTSYPTAAQVLSASTRVLKASCLSLDVSLSPKDAGKGNNVQHHNHLNGSLSKSEKRLSSPPKELIGSTPPPSPNAQQLDGRRGSTPHRRTRTASESSTRRATGARPMYRDDIFFGASLQRLPEYGSKTSAMNYTMSVSRLPTRADVEEEKQSKCKMCPEAVKRTLATMLDMSLLRSPTFMLLAASGFFTMMGFYVPFNYLSERAVSSPDVSWTNDQAVWLVGSIGIVNTIARVVCGVLTSMPRVNALLINNIALTLGGLGTMFSGLSLAAWYQYSYATVFGIAIACFASLRSILVVELMGLDKLTNAFGLLLLFQGIAACIGTPIAAAFKDATESYDYTFYMSGSLILVSAIMCYPLNMLNTWEKRRKDGDVETKTAKLV